MNADRILSIDEYCNDFVVNVVSGSLLPARSAFNIFKLRMVAINDIILPGTHSAGDCVMRSLLLILVGINIGCLVAEL